MPLLPPPDNSKAIFACAIGAGAALVIFVTTRSTLPHVGDNIHSLPHGGYYQDGTKRVAYCSPGRNYPFSGLFAPFSRSSVIVLIIALSFAIFCTRPRRENTCIACGRAHS